ncbi:MAG: hydrogenase maturation protease [Candidatus Hydrogenedentes bacterium]|nr:hydrogenase maturation protease [Candidatus Hydrogenedentota bacterium]
MKTLVLGLGNELLADDAVGILAARSLRRTRPTGVDVVETSVSGLALLDFFLGYERAIVIDAIQSGKHPPGTILEFGPSELRHVVAPSPHYTGLPELVTVADQLALDFPRQIRIFAVEVADSSTLGGELSAPVRAALPELIRRVSAQIRARQPPACPSRFATLP